MSLVFTFDAPPTGDEMERRRLLGGKGAGLAHMIAAGLPVPPGFTLTTQACRHHREHGWDADLDAAVRQGIDSLERTSGKRLGDPSAPLLVSVRSGAEVSMPGMMDTVLDVGMNATVEAALAAATDDADFAADTRCRALRSYAEVVAGAPTDVLDALGDERDPDTLHSALVDAGFGVPEDPVEQVVGAMQAVFASWASPRARRYREVEGIDHDLGTAATVQAMVFGNLGNRSGTGVAFSRDPATGAKGLMGDFLARAQGEDVVSGRRTTTPLAEMATSWPDQYAELQRIADVLERATADAVDLEFTIEDGRLWMLQARRAKRSALATFRCAVEMAEDESFPVDRAEAVARCRHHMDDPPTVASSSVAGSGVIASGLPASPGIATGVLCLDPDDAVERQAAGESVILVRRETSPSDIHGMAAATGLFTLLGGLVSHAAVVARDWGLPAVVGASDARITESGLEGPGGHVAVGTVVSVDGSAGTLSIGESAVGRRHEAPEVSTIRAWARALEENDPAAEPADVPMEVLHGLRIKGMAGLDALAESTGIEPSSVEAALHRLAAREQASHVEARGMWRLTESGRALHADLLAQTAAPIDLDALPYERFLGLNGEFKAICTDWQMRDDEPNDHADDAYDRSVVDRLVALDAEVRPLLSKIAEVLPWTGRYADRLTAALHRIRTGDAKAFTGVLCDSYHDVWMELHEDLILTQGIDRAAEGST